ncbi:aldo/keto reductase [Bacillus licheniformis]|uniref:aldo/keto reductase n=1 Tax=Bacillus subtilis group TaxID=653685 RepID=UPI0008D1E6B0|nr:aldo/keto reductase [Bacillus licheniformis]MBT1249910.1 aldo/keto reductase [Bacillus licheniformis]MCY9238175.1 aldo/keto reductase [Bacillus licheniformis]MED1524341.1 aldo/keto reductase [Bacillus licheniformis]MED4303481.1 aldo/keto reductase [Bacillus licheniformis]MED4932424.1 aldo/keto reductase [Bacillus licheniformis]
MEYINISGTSIESSRIGLGTWAIGGFMWGGSDEKEAIQTIHAALDEGINLIDTAPAYGFGQSEEIVGKAVQQYGERDRVILATKSGLDWKQEQLYRDGSRERIIKEVDDSLKRLNTDYIDLYQVHWPDPLVLIEETAEAMKDLYDAGKIRAVGVSNFSPEQMDTFRAAAPLHTVQPPYNMFEREIEQDILPYAQDQGLTTLLYGSLCRGLLSGKMNEDHTFKGDDLRKRDPKFQKPRFKEYFEAVRKLDEFANERFGKSVLHLAARWVLDQPGASIALWGARRPDQIRPVSEITGWSLTESDQKAIDDILDNTISEQIGPEFMAPPTKEKV